MFETLVLVLLLLLVQPTGYLIAGTPFHLSGLQSVGTRVATSWVVL